MVRIDFLSLCQDIFNLFVIVMGVIEYNSVICNFICIAILTKVKLVITGFTITHLNTDVLDLSMQQGLNDRNELQQ